MCFLHLKHGFTWTTKHLYFSQPTSYWLCKGNVKRLSAAFPVPPPKCLRFLLLSPLLSNNQAWGKQASVAPWTLKLKCPAMLLWGEWCDLYYSWKDDRNLLRTDKNHHLQFPVAGILWHSLGCVWFIFVQSSLFLGTTSTDLQRPPLQLWNIVKGRKRGRIYYL